MSYARFAEDSDVYVYPDVAGHVACCGCLLGDKWNYDSPEEIVAHLRQHVAAGHKVPDELLDEDLYPPDDFVAMCFTFMCREREGHAGPHTPVDERDQAIRDNEEVRKLDAMLRPTTNGATE